jgi:hypothetical protein
LAISSPNRSPASTSEIEYHHEAVANEVINSRGGEWRCPGRGSARVAASQGMNELGMNKVGMNKLAIWCRA